jgi:HAE1 family hydrophobic/amphiphilic exporter-1
MTAKKSDDLERGSLAALSISRPTFITCLVLAILAVGWMSMKRLGVDLFPDVTFPVVVVTVPYPGAGPSEVETLISKPLEDELSTLSGIKRLKSINQDGVGTVIAEFTLETDVKFAEQQIRDRVTSAKRVLPKDIKEPTIRRVDPADQPVVILAVNADLPAGQAYDLVDQRIKPRLEQVNQVGLVEILGGRKREIRVNLDRYKLKAHEVSALQVAARLNAAGSNVPVGKVSQGKTETSFRTLGEFKNISDIRDQIINFVGSDVPVTVDSLGTVTDGLEDEKSRAFFNGGKTYLIYVFRQSGANTIAVVDGVKKRVEELNAMMANQPGKAKISVVRDGAQYIRANVTDVKESILIGISLTIFVVFYFLGNFRSTIITGAALPNSLIGAFILMALAGFTINIMTLLALSLSVGLLIDDAIVVRENIFRHMEMGKSPKQAALEGTAEVRLAVIATTLTVIAVFGPVAFLKGVTGQFFKQFGLTICFAMAISLFDALTIAPMLSTYFAAGGHGAKDVAKNGIFSKFYAATLGKTVAWFERFQVWMEDGYERLLRFVLGRPRTVLVLSAVVFFASCSTTQFVPKTFLPPQDNGEFMVALDLPPGSNLDAMEEVAQAADKIIRANPEVALTSVTIGSRDGEPNFSDSYVHLIDAKKRTLNTSQVKDKIRDQLKSMAFANPKVKDYDAVSGGMRPFILDLVGTDGAVLEKLALEVLEKLKKHPGLKDPDVSFKPGKPEFRVVPDKSRAERLGVSPLQMGQELRTQVEGDTPAKFREKGLEYDIRVRLAEDQRDLRKGYRESWVPNINGNLVRLADVAKPDDVTGPSKITRIDRIRYTEIGADITPGAGLQQIMDDITKMFSSGEVKLPEGVSFMFIGQSENFKELGESVMTAMTLAILFIYLILASLYESFAVPLTIMVALPFAVSGSIVALAITQQSLNIFSMIGIIMLLGVAVKNSILLVDYANQLMEQGLSRADAMIKSGRTRLRPILMTTMALIAGTLPVALGLNEASRQRTSMGIAIIGGLVSSMVLTLVVVPAVFSDIDRFRHWSRKKLAKLVGATSGDEANAVVGNHGSPTHVESGKKPEAHA